MGTSGNRRYVLNGTTKMIQNDCFLSKPLEKCRDFELDENNEFHEFERFTCTVSIKDAAGDIAREKHFEF